MRNTPHSPWSSSLLLAPWLGCLLAVESEPPRPEVVEPTDLEAEASEATDPSLDLGGDLLLFEDLPVVVSASRQANPQHLALTPVSVVTGNDIDDQMAWHIPDALTFVPGMDVMTLDRNRYAIGVRGLHDTFSDRTLSLIDGRPADSPGFGGSEFLLQPIHLMDIDRIEVVRGPGGATWGANAFTGVINIISRRPDDPTIHGWQTRGMLSHYGDAQATVRQAGQRGPWSWRVTGGVESHQSSRHALDDDDLVAVDRGQRFSVDSDAILTLSDRTSLRLGLGAIGVTSGSYAAYQRYPVDEDAERHGLRGIASLDHAFDDQTTLRIDLTNTWQRTVQPSLTEWWAQEHDLSAWLSRSLADHEVIVGANLRYVRSDTDPDDPEDLRFVGDDDETNIGVFALDRWTVAPDWIVEASARLDDYSPTSADWSGRLGTIHSFGDRDRQQVRLAVARAIRHPYSAWRRIAGERVFVMGTPLLIALPPEDLDNEQTWAVEAGYQIHGDNRWSLRVDGYYQRFEDLIGVVVQPVGMQQAFTITNIDGADSWGFEAEATWSRSDLDIGLWYALNELDTDIPDQPIRAALPATHKAGLRLQWRPIDRVTVDCRARWTDETEGDPLGTSAEDWIRVDLAVHYRPLHHDATLSVGVHDLFDDTDITTGGVGDSAPHPTPGRTALVRLDWRF